MVENRNATNFLRIDSAARRESGGLSIDVRPPPSDLLTIQIGFHPQRFAPTVGQEGSNPVVCDAKTGRAYDGCGRLSIVVERRAWQKCPQLFSVEREVAQDEELRLVG